jgi:hypothetical protein
VRFVGVSRSANVVCRPESAGLAGWLDREWRRNRLTNVAGLAADVVQTRLVTTTARCSEPG